MKLDKKNRERIINPLLSQMDEELEEVKYPVRFTGKQLIKSGEMKDEAGNPIFPDRAYKKIRTVRVPVNHKRRMNKIIDAASDVEAMKEGLAKYLNEHGRNFRERRERAAAIANDTL